MDLDIMWRQFYQYKPMLDEQYAEWQKAQEAKKADEEAKAEKAAAEETEDGAHGPTTSQTQHRGESGRR